MVRLARGAARGLRGKPIRGRGMGMPPPLMARNNIMPPPIPPPHLPHPRMRPLPPPGMRSPPFRPPPLPPPHPPPHMRHPPARLPPVPPPMRRNLPFPPRPPIPPHVPPMFLPPGPIHGMPPPPLMRGRGRLPRGMETRHMGKIRRLGVTPFKSKKGMKKPKPGKEKNEGDFYCDTCDRGFNAEEKLQLHISEHVVCGIDGCTLTMHQKMIENHIRLQHDTGLYNKIAEIVSPEAVTEWIQERKRNYPTRENIEKKLAQSAEMEQRGERIHDLNNCVSNKPRFQNNLHGKNKKDGKHKDNVKKNTTAKKNNRRARTFELPAKILEIDQQDSWNGSLPHFPGTASFPEDDCDEKEQHNENYSDSEWENDTSVTENSNSVSINSFSSVLAALNDAYGSDSESPVDDSKQTTKENEEGKDENVLKDVIVSNETVSNYKVVNGNSESVIEDDNSEPEEVPILRETPSQPDAAVNNISNSCTIKDKDDDNQQTKNERQRNRKRKRPNKTAEPVKKQYKEQHRNIPPKRLTLLQKLLAPEIRHERNVILQCVRYVVQNNFFGIGQ